MSSLAVRTASEPGNAGQDKSSTVKMNGVSAQQTTVIYYYTLAFSRAAPRRARRSCYNVKPLMCFIPSL